jgi:hypothetical protein|uniref:SLATT domain-containing protein n=1 Tax=viral metagenome TaxID=1070528 RepID=A0A6C0CPY1_9ZZZZ|tara:strand:+ start:1050 stop:1751 length:702 start_codon:yes stop_codon:yes gene_type:complete
MTDPECTWCDKQEKLLIRWAEKAAGYRWLHNHSRIFYKRQNDWLAYPSIIIASITGVGGFAVLNPSGNDGVSSETKTRIIIIQYGFACLNVLAGILSSISKFSQSLSLSEGHSAMCIQWSKFYRNIDMELSLDVKHRANMVDFIMKCREDYDRLLDEAPDIPSISIQAFMIQFPDKENKPDVCNGLSIVVSDETNSVIASKRAVSRWLNAFSNVKDKRKSISNERELTRLESV